MAAKANGPTVLPAVEMVEETGLASRLFNCCGKQNGGMNGRVMPSNAVSMILFSYTDLY